MQGDPVKLRESQQLLSKYQNMLQQGQKMMPVHFAELNCVDAKRPLQITLSVHKFVRPLLYFSFTG